MLAEVVPCLRLQSHGERLSLLNWAWCCPNMLMQTLLFSSMAHELKKLSSAWQKPAVCSANRSLTDIQVSYTKCAFLSPSLYNEGNSFFLL